MQITLPTARWRALRPLLGLATNPDAPMSCAAVRLDLDRTDRGHPIVRWTCTDGRTIARLDEDVRRDRAIWDALNREERLAWSLDAKALDAAIRTLPRSGSLTLALTPEPVLRAGSEEIGSLVAATPMTRQPVDLIDRLRRESMELPPSEADPPLMDVRKLATAAEILRRWVKDHTTTVAVRPGAVNTPLLLETSSVLPVPPPVHGIALIMPMKKS